MHGSFCENAIETIVEWVCYSLVVEFVVRDSVRLKDLRNVQYGNVHLLMVIKRHQDVISGGLKLGFCGEGERLLIQLTWKCVLEFC